MRCRWIGLGVTVVLAGLSPRGAQAQEGYVTEQGGVAGGAGGPVVRVSSGTGLHQALCNRAKPDEPIIIEVEGTINHGNTSGVSGSGCDAAGGDDRIELKGVSRVSIIGVGSGALFDEIGIHVRGASDIILQNLHVRNVKKSGSPTSNGGDAIGMESDVHHVWVDHCTLEASGGEADGYDALFDLKDNTRFVTLSYSILRNSGRGGLVGSSDGDDGNGPVTYHHNLYENLDSRVPLLRHATAHAYNNHYTGINKSGLNPRIGGQIKAEHNYFENAKDPIGTFYTNDMGYWEVKGNVFAATVTWSSDGDQNHPAGPNPVSTTSIAIPYAYALDTAECIPAIVAATAGANTGMMRSDGSCAEPEEDAGVTTPTDAGMGQEPDADASTPSAMDGGGGMSGHQSSDAGTAPSPSDAPDGDTPSDPDPAAPDQADAGLRDAGSSGSPSTTAASSGGGCAVTTSSAASGWLTMLGLTGLLLRRQRHRRARSGIHR